MTKPANRIILPLMAIGLAVLSVLPAFAVKNTTSRASREAVVSGPLTLVAMQDVKFYRVRPDFNGQPEFLFEIAERFLGNGNRYNEIFELNKGRVQPDGLSLTDPTRILAGWIIELPADAKGEGVETGPLPTFAAAPTFPAGTPTSAPPKPDGQPSTTPAEGVAAPPSATSSTGFPVVAVAVAVVVVALAAGFFLLYRRRVAIGAQPTVPAPRTAGVLATAPLRSALPVAAPPAASRRGFLGRARKNVPAPATSIDTAASWTMDRALRALATASAAAGRPAPELYTVTLNAEQMVLRLAAPDDHPPAPWASSDDGRTWTASLRTLQGAPVDPTAAIPASRLVTLGTAEGTRVLLNLGQADGMITVNGPGRAARTLGHDWLTELATSPWSDGVWVVAAGLGDAPQPGSVAPPGYRPATFVPDLKDALAAIAAQANRDATAATGVLISAEAPSAKDTEQMLALAASPDWAVLILDTTRGARWEFTIHPDGRLDTGALGMTVNR